MSAPTLKVKADPRPNSRIALEVEVPAERCKASIEEALSRLTKTANLPGFRKGKVPKAVIIQQLGTSRIQATALENLLQKVWEEALDQKNIEPLCEPDIKNGFESLLQNFNPEKNLIIEFETDISPTPILKKTKGLTAETEKITYDPHKIDELIEQSRKQLATIVPVENRAAKTGDIAVVNFKGTYSDNGSEIEGGSGEAMEIELEKGKMIPGFIEGVIGMLINEEKSLKCQFPEDYHQEDSKGRNANFKVTLKDLKTRELPDLDDAFAKQASEKETMAELKSDLEKRLKDDAERNQKQSRQESLLKELIKELEVDLPKSLIDLEVRNLVEQTARNFAQQGIDVKSMFTNELVENLMKSSRNEAEDNLRRNFALQALAKKEEIEISDSELTKKLAEIQKELGDNQKIDQTKLKQAVSDDLLQEKLLIWLEDNNTVIEKQTKEPKKIKEQQSTTKPKKKKPSAKETTKE
tara:strand:+ start:2574 stop:3977 length:1404 start_codon:yes stop_codon:yes gene_type:complete